MNDFTGIGREHLWDSIELNTLSFNQSITPSAFATFLETLVPLRVSVEEGLYYAQQQQQSTSFLKQSPQSQSLGMPGYRNWLSIFIAYAGTDQRFLPKITEILQAIQYQVQNVGWQFGEIAQDTRWKMPRHDYLKTANLILLLVTPAFVATEYCYCEQLRWAIIRHKQELSYVIPVLMKKCLWDRAPFAMLESITPSNHKAVDEWRKPNLAYTEIATDMRSALEYLRMRQ